LEFPERLSETGYFQDLGSLQPANDFVAYTLNSPLWSDGLEKQRWVKIPAGTKIDNAGDEETDWKFPEGTVFLKHFSDPLDDHRPIETRVLIQGPETIVAGVTYRWNEDRSDAVMVKEREVANINKVQSEPMAVSHILPGPNDCLVCHTRDNCVLGLNVLQMNRSVRTDSSTTNIVLESVEVNEDELVARSPVASAIGSD
jgi:hypothetical protein